MNKQLKILVVEDESALREAYQIILQSNGYEVFAAPNGQEGLVLLKKYIPDVVLLDLFMPVLDGREFMKNVDIEAYPRTRFVAFSNINDRESKNEMIKLGVHKYILKSSLTPRDLLRLITQVSD